MAHHQPLKKGSVIPSIQVDDSTKNSCGQTDLFIARKIQAAMIPKRLPMLQGLELNSLYLPCGAVGGDLFDVVQISDDVLAILIFDVTGFGVSSALISAMAKVCFSNYIRNIDSPRAVIEHVNSQILNEINADFYITAFLGYLDLHDNKLTYCNAGHAYPIVFRKKEGIVTTIKTQGTFLGVFENGSFEEHCTYLGPGDCLILLTDGLYRLFADDLYEGRKCLEDYVRETLSKNSSREFLNQIEKRYKKINQGIEDDITALTVEVLTDSRRNQIKEKLGFSTDDPVYLQFLSYFEETDKAVSVILSSMDAFGFADESIRKMKIALTELLVNAVLHGNKKDFSKKVVLGHLVNRQKTVVSIMDEGEGFDPNGIPDPTLPENITRDCGRGLFIVRHYVDEITFNLIGNRVTVTKYH